MLIRFVVTALALAFAAMAAPGRSQQDERAAIDFALERGRLLHALDRAAWVATDDMMERVRGWRDAGMSGFVVEPDGGGYAVIFYGGPEEAPVAFYRGRVANHRIVGREVYPADARPPLTPLQRRLVAARAAAAGTSRRPCANAPFNVAVIPPASEDAPIDVYLMTPQIERGAWPVGGHYRLTVAPDGQIVSERAFTNGCLTMSGMPRGAAAMVVTHMLDPVPTEIHVFTALAARVPLIVMTGPERLFEVTGERIQGADLSERPASQ